MLHPAIEMLDKGGLHGNGLFATERIPEGTILWRLTEPTYTWEEVQEWSEDRLKDFKRYGFQCGADRYSLPADDSREVNHSCNPNMWWLDSYTLISRWDIRPGEELTYDYASCDITQLMKMDCNCRTQGCREIITNLDYLDSSWQKQFGLNLPPHVLDAIESSSAGDFGGNA